MTSGSTGDCKKILIILTGKEASRENISLSICQASINKAQAGADHRVPLLTSLTREERISLK